jgi:hypothetical protein
LDIVVSPDSVFYLKKSRTALASGAAIISSVALN